MLNVIKKGIPQDAFRMSNVTLGETRYGKGNREQMLFPGVVIMIMPLWV